MSCIATSMDATHERLVPLTNSAYSLIHLVLSMEWLDSHCGTLGGALCTRATHPFLLSYVTLI